MTEFQDGHGKTRTLDLTVFTVERIRSLVQFVEGDPVDLFKIADEDLQRLDQTPGKIQDRKPTTLERLQSDPVTLAKVVHAAMDCEFEEFARSMNGEGLANAVDALIGEIIKLFPPSSHPAMELAHQKGKELEERISEKSLKLIQSKAFDNHLDKTFREFDERFGKLLDDSALTPDPTP